MSRRAFLIYGGILLGLIAVQAGLLVRMKHRSHLATLVCRGTNAGVPLAAGDARVFVHPPGRHGELAADGSLYEALRLPAGVYDVRILYTRSRDRQDRWLTDVRLERAGRVVKGVDFSAGELSIDATVGGGSGEEGRVVVYVFLPEDHDHVVTSMPSGERVLLAAGDYDLRVVLTLGSREKGVRWLRGVSVEPGIHTSRDVTFERGAFLIKARNGGREMPPGGVELTVFRAGDVQEEEVDRGLAGVPLWLPVGQYDVRATFSGSHDNPSRWLRGLQVIENETVEDTVDFSSGTFLIRAEMEGGRTLGDFQVYVYYYRAGDHEQPVAYTPAGEPALLEAGRYDLRANFFRSHDRPELWRRDVVLEAGKTVAETLTFPSGRLLVRAYDPGGRELVGDNVFLAVYAAGERTQPIASGRSGEQLILSLGVYDIRATDTRNPSAAIWLSGVHLRAGRLVEDSVTFPGPPGVPSAQAVGVP